MRRAHAGAAGALTVLALTLTSTVGTALAAPDPDRSPPLSEDQERALDAGFQVAAKSEGAGGTGPVAEPTSPNPYVANLPEVTKADYAGWRARMAAQGERRADSRSLAAARARADTGRAAPADVYDEQEPADTAGSNDTAADAEPVRSFGTGAQKNNRVRILGELADLGSPTPETLPTPAEDDGSIPLATDTGVEGRDAVETTAVLGDGPHGSAGDGTNDFDVYAADVPAGQTLTATTVGTSSGLDTVLAVYDAEGTLVASDDDGGGNLLSLVTYTPETAGTYYVLAAGYSQQGPLPADPFDSGSGAGGADEGEYALRIDATQVDTDQYSVRLRPGDVLGGVAEGGATGLAITKPDGERVVGAVGLDASSLYPPTSPLPGGGNTTLAYVAEERGSYAIQATGGTGGYDLTVEAYRPGSETDEGRRQTVLLDYAPGRVNSATWGGPGVSQVSPFSAFVPQWGIARSRARALQDQVTATVRDDIRTEVQEAGLNDRVSVRVLDARGHRDLIGRENVSRIYVAGTIAETGISTIGIAQYIDPGNYGHQDEAIVLLDVLSEPAGPISSLNTFMTPESDREAFVAQAVGNVTAHEIGHTVGSYHTDFANDVHNIMDSGGGFFAENLFGVGPDGIGGTADDEDGRFETDTYSPAEGFTGLEDTLNVTAWAYADR